MQRPHAPRERGAAAVEFALVLPILVIFVFGIVDLGRAFMAQVVLTNAAREGTRIAQIRPDSMAASPTVGTIAEIEARAEAAVVDPTLTPSATFYGCSGTPSELTVEVDANFNWLFLNILPGVPASVTMTGKSIMGCV